MVWEPGPRWEGARAGEQAGGCQQLFPARSLAARAFSEALGPDAREALSLQHHELGLRREDSRPASASSSNWLNLL